MSDEPVAVLAGGPFGWSVCHVADEDFWRWSAWGTFGRSDGTAVSLERAEAEGLAAAQALSGS